MPKKPREIHVFLEQELIEISDALKLTDIKVVSIHLFRY